MKLLKFDRKTFDERFGGKKDCYQCLAELKWGLGYACRRCEGTGHIKGKQPFSRRCCHCGHDGSTTTGTLFHKLKSDIGKAFGMLYEISTSRKGANSVWLAERFGVQQNTAWSFRQKVQIAMESSGNNPLEGDVHVDEFGIGTPKGGEQGRSQSDSKMRVVLAIEHREGKPGRAYAKVIEGYSAKSLKPIFDGHIDNQAFVLADGWTGYSPMKEEFPNLKQVPSDKGRNFPMLHIQTRNFKNWLRGVHSCCGRGYLQKYIDEYFFRFNRRNHRESIMDKPIERCIQYPPINRNPLILLET